MNGLATQQLLKKLNAQRAHNDPDYPLGPESFGLPRPPSDPHDVEGRKWFRRALIALCVLGFAIIFMPDFVRARLNTWAGTPTQAQPQVTGVNTRLCTNDWHERCLVCTHVDAKGQRVQSSHC